MAKKSFLQKIGLIEKEDQEMDLTLELNELRKGSNYDESDDLLDVPENLNLEGVSTVNEIYTSFNLDDITKSIFKVDEFSSVLPKELPTDIRKTSVLGILSTSNLDINDLLCDAENRINALRSTENAFDNETTQITTQCSEEITLLEDKINLLKTTINERKKAQEQQKEIIQQEIEKIEKIVKFIK